MTQPIPILIKTYLSIAGLRLISLVLAAILMLLVIVVIPADDFGRFNLMMSVGQVIVAASLSFFNLALLRYARASFTLHGVIGEALATRSILHLLLLAIVLPVIWLSFPWLSSKTDVLPQTLPLLLILTVVISLSEMGTVCAQSVGRLAGYGSAQVLFRLVQVFTLTFMYVAAINDWTMLLIGTVAGYGVAAAVPWSRIPRKAFSHFRPSLSMLRRFLSFSWSIPAAGLTLVVMNWMDLWFIGWFMDLESVGIYAWAYNLSMAGTALLAPLAALIGPRTIDLRALGDVAEIRRMVMISQPVFLLALTTIPLVASIFAAAVSLLPLGTYAGVVAPAMVLFAAVAFQLGRYLWEPQVHSFEALVVRSTAVIITMGLINALGDWVLIPRMGIVGAAIATAIAFAFGAMALLAMVRVSLGVGGPSLVGMTLFTIAVVAPVTLAALSPGPVEYALCALVTPILFLAARKFGLFAAFGLITWPAVEHRETWPTRLLRAVVSLTTQPEELTRLGDDIDAAFRSEEPVPVFTGDRRRSLKQTRILHVITDLRSGGAERMLTSLVTSPWAESVDFRVVSLTKGGHFMARLREAGITVIDLDMRSLVSAPLAFLRLIRIIRRYQPQVIQSWMYHADLAATFALILSWRRRQTRLYWGIRCSNMDQRRYSPILRYVIRLCTWLSFVPDKIVANSRSGLEYHRKIGYRPRSDLVIENGVDTAVFHPDADTRRQVRRELRLDGNSPILAMVARKDPMKDHATFFTALERVPNAVALLVGSGTDQFPDLPRVLKLGESTDIARLLTACDLTISSSAFGEGFSNALLEGMSCGLPAVATDVGDAREIVGDTGLIVPPGNPEALAEAINSLLEEPEESRLRRRERARDRVIEKFSLEVAVEKFERLYNRES